MAVGGSVAPAHAQTVARPGVEIQLPAPSRLADEGPLVRSRAILNDAGTRELLRSGFPTRLRFKVELWADGRIFDELQGTVDWQVVVRFRGVDQMFEVIQIIGDRELSLGAFEDITDAESAMSRPVRVPLNPPGDGRRYYYRVALDVQTLSVSDLDEVARWLRGGTNPGTALTRGARSLAARLLGGERREYSTRSASFRPHQ